MPSYTIKLRILEVLLHDPGILQLLARPLQAKLSNQLPDGTLGETLLLQHSATKSVELTLQWFVFPLQQQHFVAGCEQDNIARHHGQKVQGLAVELRIELIPIRNINWT